MAYLGNSTSLYDPTRSSPSTPQVFSGDGSTLTFTLQRSVGCSTDIFVMVENVVQQPDYAYTASGTQLTFTAAPGAGTNNIYVVYEKVTGLTSTVPDGSITASKLANNIRLLATDQFTGNGVVTQWSLSDSPYDANSLIVTVNGVGQAPPTNYTVSGNTITFTSAPSSGANVVIRNVGFRTTQTLYALSSNSSVVQPVITGGSITNSSISGGTANNLTITNGTANNLTIANSTFSGGLSGNNITANTISNTAFQTGSVENYMSAQGSQLGGMRNKIINGAMMIDQRNSGNTITFASGPASPYTIDRYYVAYSQNSKITAQQNQGSVTPPVGFSNYLGFTSSSAYSITSSDYFILVQPIEGLNISDLSWGNANAKTVTLSFWVYSSLTGTFGGSLRNSAYNRSYPFSYSISSSNTWTKISIVIPGDTSGTWLVTNGIGISVGFTLGSGSTYSGTPGTWAGANYHGPTGATSVVGTSGATFYITGIQLEPGATATPFENRLYGTELALCQRYFVNGYQGITAPALTSSKIVCAVQFPVPMRASVTANFVSGQANGATNFVNMDSPGYINNMTFVAGLNAAGSPFTANVAQYGYVNYTASAEL